MISGWMIQVRKWEDNVYLNENLENIYQYPIKEWEKLYNPAICWLKKINTGKDWDNKQKTWYVDLAWDIRFDWKYYGTEDFNKNGFARVTKKTTKEEQEAHKKTNSIGQIPEYQQIYINTYWDEYPVGLLDSWLRAEWLYNILYKYKHNHINIFWLVQPPSHYTINNIVDALKNNWVSFSDTINILKDNLDISFPKVSKTKRASILFSWVDKVKPY